MSIVSHEDLMIQAQNGNLSAFEILVEIYREPLFNFLYRMVNGERGPAEDLLQEVFVKIYEARKYYEPKAKLSTWFFTIARNRAINFLLSRPYRQDQQTVSLEAMVGKQRGKTEATPFNNAARMNTHTQELGELLEQAVSRLPNEYKEVFVLHAVEGFSHQDVAATLKMNPATVRTKYHRARTMLREKVSACLAQKGIKI